ncbi:MAG: hypothetical protein EA382_13400 [Spirochaetaceae bacterium]|nr:MAG: hypothetical protein EA382_13400 [Spirochaetaceae bacterium]
MDKSSYDNGAAQQARSTRTRRIVVATVLFVGTNALLSTYRWIPAGAPLLALVPLPETIVFAWIAYGIAWLRQGAAASRRAAWLAARGAAGVTLGLMIGFSVAETLFEYVYARSFAPRLDIPMTRGGLLLLLGEIGPIVDVLTPIAVALIFAALFVAGVLIVRAAEEITMPPIRLRAAIGGTALLAVVSVGFGVPDSLTAITVLSWQEDGRVEFAAYEDVAAGGEARSGGEITADDGLDPDRAQYAFPGLRDRDVYVFMVEAYGVVAFTRDDINRQLAPSLRRLEAALADNGHSVVSSALEAPVAGGFSWIAEATLLTGQWIATQQGFEQLYGAGLPTLTGLLHDGGYYTFTIRPGTVHGEWPEGWDLYRFEESMLAYGRQIGYRGPIFSYVATPDQYSIWRTHQRIGELRASGGEAHDRPLLVYYQLVSSHTPFNRIPPVIEEWELLGGGEVYTERADQILTFNNTWTGGTQMDEGYVASLRYVFDVIAKYIEELLDHESEPIIVILGDHQPQRPIREPDATRSVPIHVASRDQAILDAFRSIGYTDGLHGDAPGPHARMSEFFPAFTRIARGLTERRGR